MAQTAVTDVLAESFVIEGGHRLNGRVRAAGNKNGALPVLAACLLTSEPVVLSNVPRIRDVETMMALIAALGADAEWTGENEVRVHAADVSTHELDAELVEPHPRLVPARRPACSRASAGRASRLRAAT